MDRLYAGTSRRIWCRDTLEPPKRGLSSNVVCLARLSTAGPAASVSATCRRDAQFDDQVRQILTVWITHASSRGIQLVERELTGQGLSLATITATLAEAQQRALAWMQTHRPPSVRALALDEVYANDRTGAYLNVVDVRSSSPFKRNERMLVHTGRNYPR